MNFPRKLVFQRLYWSVKLKEKNLFLFPFRVRLRSGKLELVSTRKDGLFDAGDMPEHSAGV